MALVDGGTGGGETVPPTGGGGGSITLIESTDASVTVTDGSGPTVDLSVAVSGGSYASIDAYLSTVPTPGTIGVGSFDLPFRADASLGNYDVGGYTSVPQVASALGLVCSGFYCDIGGIDTTSDPYLIVMDVTISDLTGTNILTINGNATASAGGPNDGATVDWTTVTATAVAGTDLVWDAAATTVTSTAGGVYVVSVYCVFGWD